METLSYINYLIAIFFTVCYSYQFLYIIVVLIAKQKVQADAAPHRFAIMISARNERAVIGELIKSIKAQKYPSELVDIYIVADNCTDDTAEIAQRAGATAVFVREDKTRVGKGYALNFLFDKVKESAGDIYDGYFIFDADNLLDEHFIYEMNKTFAAGSPVVTSYRNSKNYGTNWISAGYSLWFLREARYLNCARMQLGLSCAVSGTGFLISRELINKNNGWNYFLLTEDIEFSIDCVIKGKKIGYCDNAILYDEQPIKFAQSWRQRLRWSKGYLQVFGKYWRSLLKNVFLKGNLSAADMTMVIFPAIVLTLVAVLLNVGVATAGLILYRANIMPAVNSILETLRNAYLTLAFIGGLTVITEWKRIYATKKAKIFYIFTFPIFLFTYVPISVASLFRRIEWKPIEHGVVKTLDEVKYINKN